MIMDQIAERKYEVLKCLDKEMESLTALRDLTNRSSTVAAGMGTILDSFEHRLAKLETTILPVYQQTGNLQRRHQNIEKTLSALDHVLSFYNVAGETEGIIRGGRPGEGTGGIEGYITALDKLAAACHYFRTHNPQSVELSNVSTLFDAGSEALSREFRDELKKYQHPLNPVVTLELVALEGDEVTKELLSNIELVPPSACDDLALVATWLDAHSHSDKLTVYAKVRSQTMMQSLQALRDHQRSSSAEHGGVRGLGAATPSGGAAQSSPSPAPALRSRFAANKTDASTPRSRGHKITNILERKTHWMLQRAKGGRPGLLSTGASPTLAASSPFSPYTPSTPYSPGVSASPGSASAAEDGLDDSDALLYLAQVTGVCRLGVLEQRLLQVVVPPARHTTALETLLREPIDNLAAQGEVLCGSGITSMHRGDTSSVLCLLSVLRHVELQRGEYQRLLQHCTHSLLDKYSAIVTQLQDAVVQCLEVVTEGVKGEGGERTLPRDGTVHQQTSNVLFFLHQLQDYSSTLGPVLVQDSWLRTTACVQPHTGHTLTPEQGQALLAAYIKRVLSYLGLFLVQCSEGYSDATLRAVFRLNNYNYLLSTLLSTGLVDTLEVVETTARQSYRDLIVQQKRTYLQSWGAVLRHLSPPEELTVAQMQAGRLRDRDKQVLKDKFAGFNKEMEEMQRTQRSYSLPDRKLRDSIKRDNKEYILPKYQAFYDRYSGVAFSRNPEKYIKYSPADVASLMDKFFDVAA